MATWAAFQLAVSARALFRGRRGALWFAPEVPQRWYLVRPAMLLAGLRVARSAEAASAAFFFEDATRSVPPQSVCSRRFNFGCGDISKSHVAAVFEGTFGYPLTIDPARWTGEAVEKAETNGAHDGRIVACPRAAAPGKVYQRLIDTVDAQGQAIDLRTHCIGGRAVLVWVKKRPAAERFLPPNDSVELEAPEAVFSGEELAAIARFCVAMRLDWGALDILRDGDRRIYVVDVNKTDAGPITALTLRQKLRSIEILADALARMVLAA